MTYIIVKVLKMSSKKNVKKFGRKVVFCHV